MKDLGGADAILNIKLIKGENEITLLQSHYVEKVLSCFGYTDSKSSPTPYDPSLILRKDKRLGKDHLRYSQIIGSLMYLASATRPDISFAVSKLSRFSSNPGDDHWRGIDRVLCYLKGTMSYGIHYLGYPSVLEGYSDSNWITDADELKATSGYIFKLGGGAISWRSCKQTILTKSTMEVLAFFMPNWNRYSASAQNHRCSTSPWSIPGYRIFPQGSTMVISIINQMITVLP